MQRVEQRMVIQYLNLKQITPNQFYKGFVDILGKTAESYDRVRCWSREFKCGRWVPQMLLVETGYKLVEHSQYSSDLAPTVL